MFVNQDKEKCIKDFITRDYYYKKSYELVDNEKRNHTSSSKKRFLLHIRAVNFSLVTPLDTPLDGLLENKVIAGFKRP